MKFSELAHFVLGTELLLRRQDRRAFDHFSRSAIEGFPLALAVVGFFFEFGMGGLFVDYASAERYDNIGIHESDITSRRLRKIVDLLKLDWPF